MPSRVAFGAVEARGIAARPVCELGSVQRLSGANEPQLLQRELAGALDAHAHGALADVGKRARGQRVEQRRCVVHRVRGGNLCKRSAFQVRALPRRHVERGSGRLGYLDVRAVRRGHVLECYGRGRR